MGVVRTERRGRVSVVTIDNPPVNALGAEVRKGLAKVLEEALADARVVAIVLAGAGKLFSGGADIQEFGKEPPADAPVLPDLINRVEAATKPVVVALHGVAAGGALEIALGCHFRVAAEGTRVGLPEVMLGLVPGAGGTQRLPRLIGVAEALEAIVAGELMPAEKAKSLGLLDEVATGEVVEAAVAFAERLVAAATPPRRTGALEDKIEAARENPGLFAEFRKDMARRARGYEAPFACVDAVEGVVRLPFAQGLANERAIFKRMVASDQSRAQRHVFFAEREVAKIPDVPKETRSRDIARAAVIGAGTMGGGIAMNFANAGIPVTVIEANEAALAKGLAIVGKSYAAGVAKGRLAQSEADARMGLIAGSTDYADVAAADIVVEAVFEDMALKKDVFRRLDQVCKRDAILTTNTSSLDVDDIAAATSRPENVMGTHFFSPANVMRLIENVRGKTTSKETIATVMALSKRIGKVGVLVGVCDGFVGNRMLYAYTRQANFLLEEGALPQQVDKVIYDFGFPMGPFAMGDLAGLDVGWRVRRAQAPTRPKHLRYSPTADRICEMGRFGQKTGAGWYRYGEGSRAPMPDPEIERLIRAVSDELGIARRMIGDEEILERCLYPLINEGAKILEEGIAARPLDIDIIWIYGYGFPRYRGGPMFYADLVGVRKVYDAMSRLYDTHGDWLEPAPLLARLANEGKGFGDL